MPGKRCAISMDVSINSFIVINWLNFRQVRQECHINNMAVLAVLAGSV